MYTDANVSLQCNHFIRNNIVSWKNLRVLVRIRSKHRKNVGKKDLTVDLYVNSSQDDDKQPSKAAYVE